MIIIDKHELKNQALKSHTKHFSISMMGIHFTYTSFLILSLVIMFETNIMLDTDSRPSSAMRDGLLDSNFPLLAWVPYLENEDLRDPFLSSLLFNTVELVLKDRTNRHEKN